MMQKKNFWVQTGQALTTWRTASVTLLSFSSGLPLGLVWIAIPDWLRSSGVDIRWVGLITLAQAPWAFKVFWSPFMDRFVPPFLGRRRGWAALAQLALFVFTLALAGVGNQPGAFWVVGALALAIAISSATQDIALDAYAVEVLRKEEHGVAVGARIGFYRAAMYVAGGLSITLAAQWSWSMVNVLLACLYLPMLWVTWKAPEPEEKQAVPTRIRDAIWLPFLEFLSRRRALEILAFVLLYKLSDNLGSSLLRPFLVDMGYSDFDRGVALATVGLASTLFGTFLGGAVTPLMSLGRALWFFGFLQIFSNLGYVLLSQTETHRGLMYAAMTFENVTSGMGTGAFSVLLLRLTKKKYAATQYAFFTCLFSLPRILGGPLTGYSVHAFGWELFFWGTIAAGIPGLILLHRFSPLGEREPTIQLGEPVSSKGPISRKSLWMFGGLGAGVGFVLAWFLLGLAQSLEAIYKGTTETFLFWENTMSILAPTDVSGWIGMVSLFAFSGCVGFLLVATLIARRGIKGGSVFPAS